jgi:hypothetical protein
MQLLRFYGELRALEWRNTEVMQKMRRPIDRSIRSITEYEL